MTVPVLGELATAPWPGIVVVFALGGALLAWRLAARDREPVAAVRAVPHAYPNRDPVSVAVDALGTRAYGRLLDRARTQLATVSVRTTGRPLDALPSRWGRGRARAAPPVRTVRRLRARLRALRARASWRERSWAPRHDPWRSSDESDRRFRAEIARFLLDLSRAARGGGP